MGVKTTASRLSRRLGRLAARRKITGFTLAAALILTGCNGGEPPERLSVVVRTTPAAWYFEEDGNKGIDHDLLALFAESLGVAIEISHAPSTGAALDALCNPRAQLAVGLLTPPPGGKLRTAPRYGVLKQQLLRHFNQPRPSSTTDLIVQNVEIGAEPAQIETLRRIGQRNGDLSRWKLHQDLSPHDLIELTDRGFVEYTVADSHAVTMTRRFYPRIKETFDLSDELPLHWIFGECADERIVAAAEAFFTAAEADGTLEQIFDRYYGHATQLGYPDKLTFVENIHRRLGRYKPLFIEAARQTGLDWRLLAALGYQESRWDPKAHSPSGVTGLMMLTLETAKQVKVWDRNDPYQSITGGARFLLSLKQRLPPGIEEPDRTWFALAAYNSGLARVERAMKTARDNGRNSLLWVGVRDFLRVSPGKRKRPVNLPFTYVYNVRAYRDVLAWSDEALRFDVRGEAPQTAPGARTPAPL